MTKDEALKIALEALETALDFDIDAEDGYYLQAITAIKEALAQEQKPVATVESVATVVSESGNQEVTMSWWHEPALPVGTKLYTTPPQPEQEQEPAEWPRTMERGTLVQWLHFEMVQHTLDEGTIDKLIEDAQAIPATPPQRTWVGLTEQQLNDIENDFWVVISKHVFDAIEAKLKQNNGYAEEKNT